MRNLKKIFYGIYSHPLNSKRKIKALFVFLNWQIRCFFTKKPLIYKLTKNCKIYIYKSEPASTANLYYGLHEYSNMLFLIHYLVRGDVFVDVGSNLGIFSVLASGETGCKSIIVEPIPQNCVLIRKNIELNNLFDKVEVFEIAIGSKNETGRITAGLKDQNYILSSSDNRIIASDNYDNNFTKVEIKKMDFLIKDEDPSVIKIDVEGYESEVIDGAQEILSKDSLKAVIIELRGIGNKRYSFDENLIEKKLFKKNFKKYYYNPFRRKLSEEKFDTISEPIFIRDKDQVEKKLMKGNQFLINDFIL